MVLINQFYLPLYVVLITTLGHLRGLYVGYKYTYNWLISSHEPPSTGFEYSANPTAAELVWRRTEVAVPGRENVHSVGLM